jgi:DNA repair protein RadC
MPERSIIELSDDELISHAAGILESRLRYRVSGEMPEPLTNPQVVKDFLKLKLAELEHEVFAILFLDNRHRLLHYEEMFRGTIDGASVHPREVVKVTLRHNAAAVILAHNHPSGVPEPSRADEALTRRLRDALGLIDVRVLDHVIVGGTDTISFAESGLI